MRPFDHVDPDILRRELRAVLVLNDLRLLDLARESGIAYGTLQSKLSGVRELREDERERLRTALEQLVGNR